VADLYLVLWAAIPPLLLLGYYYCRIPFAPPPLRLLMFFLIGTLSGILALSLEWIFEIVANWFVDWEEIKGWLPGIALRQLVEVGSIEESCKFAAVIVPTHYLQRRYKLLASSVFLFTIAIAFGFTAEENWVYLFYGTASIIDRTIGTQVHAMFSAPWGYALGIYISSNTRLNRDKKVIFRAWLNSIICHALVNVLSSAWRYSLPLRFLSYGLFPFLLWMFWRLEQLVRKVEGKPSITLISGNTPQRRYWQRSLVLFALLLGGNAIFGLFLLARILSPLNPSKLFDSDILWFILTRLSLNLFFGVLAWGIYRYLRHTARRRYFSNIARD
jgi:RsiW-degrading membrane proteinase PrsW (M82 family)